MKLRVTLPGPMSAKALSAGCAKAIAAKSSIWMSWTRDCAQTVSRRRFRRCRSAVWSGRSPNSCSKFRMSCVRMCTSIPEDWR
eukprot:7880534-Alexandrium_andersonii.AAC.1